MDGRILPCLGGSGKKAPEKANLPDHQTGFFMPVGKAQKGLNQHQIVAVDQFRFIDITQRGLNSGTGLAHDKA